MKYLKVFLVLMFVFTISGCSQDEIDSLNQQIAQLEKEKKTLQNDKESLEYQLIECDGVINELAQEVVFYEEVTGNKNGFVYITNTGTKYHFENCYYLEMSSNHIMYTKAINMGYTPCSNCIPYGY